MRTAVKEAISETLDEVALSKRMNELIRSPGASWFFEAHPECGWEDHQAMEAWEAWIQQELSETELEVWKDRHQWNYMTMDDLKAQIGIDMNRVPSPGNPDGY